MKKLIALLIAMTLLLGVGAVAAQAEDIHLIMAWWGNQARNETYNAILDTYAEQNEGVTFDTQFVAWDDYWKKLATAAAGHTLPDIILMDYAYMTQYQENNLLADLTDYVNSGVLDLSQINQGIVDSASSDGKIYAVCSNINAPALFYNKTLLDANGIEVKDYMTMEDFIAVSKEVYEKTGYKTNFAYACNQPLDYILRGIGHNLFTDGKFTASKEDLELYYGYFEQGIKEGWMLGSDTYAEINVSTVEQNPMVYGTDPERMSWCTFLWSNQMIALQNAAPEGMEVGVTTWPSADNKASNYLKPGGFFAVTTDSKNPEEAAKVINYLTNDIETGIKLAAIGTMAPAANVAEAVMPTLSEISKKATEYVNNVVTPNCSALPEAEPDGANEFFAKKNEIEEQLCYGVMDAKTAAEELVAFGEQLFNK